MVEYRSIERQFSLSLALRSRPVAVKFRDVPLAGIPKFTGTEPSGGIWRRCSPHRVPADSFEISNSASSLPIAALRGT